MPLNGKSGHDTATVQRLLDSAAHEFARHGYAATRVRDIVDAAGVNLAAVNYHFGGKEGLYRATLAMLASRARDDVPTDSPEMRLLPPEEQLRGFARATLLRYLGQGQASAGSRIMAHELLDPTPAFEATMRTASRPQWARLIEIVSALIGPGPAARTRNSRACRSPASGPSSCSAGACSSSSFRIWRGRHLSWTSWPTTLPRSRSRGSGRGARSSSRRPCRESLLRR